MLMPFDGLDHIVQSNRKFMGGKFNIVCKIVAIRCTVVGFWS